MQPPVHLALIHGSNREPRLCDTIAGWTARRLREHGGFTQEPLDPTALQLPAALPRTPDMATLRLRRRIRAADAFLVVTPEYNHGYPAPLKQLIDAAYDDWHAKPVAFVSYGGISGGLRAVEQLRQVFGALHAVAIHDSIAFTDAWRRFDADGRLREAARTEQSTQAMLAQLHWWAVALRNARAATPYHEAAA